MRTHIRAAVWLGLAVVAIPFAAEAGKLIEPGETIALTTVGERTSPDDVGGNCDEFLTAICRTDTGEFGMVGDPFGARATVPISAPFSRGSASVFQAYEFDIDASGRSGTVLLGQIFGTAKLNGFLAQIAGGGSAASLVVKIIDLGPSPPADRKGGKVVLQKTLAKHELQGRVLTGIGFDLKVEGGAPYIGFGGGPKLGVNIQAQKKLVRDSADFGLQVLLIRGHSYRVKFELNVNAKSGGLGGQSIAQFQQFDGPVVDLLASQNWLDTLSGAVDAELPEIKAEVMNLKRKAELFTPRRTIDGARDFSDALQMLNSRAAAAGMPKSFKEIVTDRFRRPPEVSDENINSAGVRVEDLRVTLQNDQVELLEEIIGLLNTPQGRRPGFPSKPN